MKKVIQEYFCDLVLLDDKRVDTVCIKQDTQEILIEADKIQELIEALNSTRYEKAKTA